MRRYELDINGKHFSIAVHEFSTKRAELEVDGTRFTVNVTDVVTDGEDFAPLRPLSHAKPLPATPTASPAAPPGRGTGIGTSATPGAGSVTAPIPGQILAVLVKEGDVVKESQPLVKLEAMKMENVIIAPASGTIASVSVHVGDAVTQGQELLVIG
jgi:glutaconyl-CoA/methylmalonyl-CoA decarboxylase subunit gamma